MPFIGHTTAFECFSTPCQDEVMKRYDLGSATNQSSDEQVLQWYELTGWSNGRRPEFKASVLHPAPDYHHSFFHPKKDLYLG